MRSAEHRCYACKIVKPVREYYATSWMCKPCHKVRDAKRRGREGDAFRNQSTEAARARKRRYADKQRFPEREAARLAVRRAVSRGEIARRTACESCAASPTRIDGVSAVHAHHDDYSKPLEVRWLCAKCHTAWHRKHDAAIAKGEQSHD